MEVTVGAFMFMILLALGFFTIVLSRENIFTRSYHMEVVFENVMGLREGDNVFVRGVDVGKIRSLQIRPDGVHVSMTLEQPVKLHEDYQIEILPSSALGGRYLNIYEGSINLPAIPASARIVGVTPVDLINEATKITQMIKEALEEGQILDNLKTTMAQVKEITTRLSEGEGTLGKLMSEDDTLYEDLKAAVNSFKNFTDSVEGGKGTIGRLMTDDELYEEAKLLLHELRATVDDFRETTPITTFTSVFFGAF
jgi:phospholipid/cholesterol/gamma-HCH transport system substrate-binding protein